MKIASILIFFFVPALFSQIVLNDFAVNPKSANANGLGKPAITAHSSGEFAVAWQDYNSYNIPGPEIPQIAVQKFNSSGSPIGQLSVFRGESRSLSIWTSDFLEDVDVSYLPDRTLLLTFEHSGRLSIGGDDVGSSEIGIGALSPDGQILDLNNTNGVNYWLIYTTTRYQENPRIAVSPGGDFYIAASGNSYETRRDAVFVQPFDANGNLNGSEIYPHASGNQPQANHLYPDFVTNGNLYLMAWQDGRGDQNFDITAQFFTDAGAKGGNIKVNTGDAAGTYNVFPAVAMNSSGESIVVWADTRHGFAGDIYGQIFNSDGQAVGSNFQISAGQGEIYYRPEVAMRNDGSFMVVWNDSSSVTGAFRAKGRQFNAAGQPLGEPFLLADQDISSGFANVTTDGTFYYLAWLDSRDRQAYWNCYAKKMGLITSVAMQEQQPDFFELLPAYPNPFNPQTTLEFNLPKSGHTVLEIFDITGRLISTLVDETLQSGHHRYIFDAADLPTGIYVARLRHAGRTHVQQLVLLK